MENTNTQRILAFSDVHSAEDKLKRIIPQLKSANGIIFCGDGINTLDTLDPDILKKLTMVKGNCDPIGSNVPIEQTMDVCGKKIFFTHGHKFTNRELEIRAKEIGADLVLFGHTHRYSDSDYGKFRIINVPSLNNGREKGLENGAYIALEINEKEINAECVTL